MSPVIAEVCLKVTVEACECATLKVDPPKKGKQETFDYVVAFLRLQGAPAVDGTACVYRGPNGVKCAAGCLIPDADYLPSMEHAACDSRVVASVLEKEGFDVGLVYALQGAHDGWAHAPNAKGLGLPSSSAEFDRHFRAVAVRRDLKWRD